MNIQDTVDKLRMNISALSERIMVGIPNKDNQSFKYRIDLTSDFMKCCIDKFGEKDMKVGGKYQTEIHGGNTKYKIILERIE